MSQPPHKHGKAGQYSAGRYPPGPRPFHGRECFRCGITCYACGQTGHRDTECPRFIREVVYHPRVSHYGPAALPHREQSFYGYNRQQRQTSNANSNIRHSRPANSIRRQ